MGCCPIEKSGRRFRLTGNLVTDEGRTVRVAGLVDVVDDTTPQLGGKLDCNGHDICMDDATGIQDDTNNYYVRFQKQSSAVGYIEIWNASTFGEPTINIISTQTNEGLSIIPKGTGIVDVTTDVRCRSVVADGDNGGVASTTSMTNSTSAKGTSRLTVLDEAGDPGLAFAGYLHFFLGTAVAKVPYYQ